MGNGVGRRGNSFHELHLKQHYAAVLSKKYIDPHADISLFLTEYSDCESSTLKVSTEAQTLLRVALI